VDFQRLYFAGHRKVSVSRTEFQAFITCTRVKSRQTTDARRISFRRIKILLWNVTEHSLNRRLFHYIKTPSKAEKWVWKDLLRFEKSKYFIIIKQMFQIPHRFSILLFASLRVGFSKVCNLREFLYTKR
jgi:hypothetical protein